MSIRIHSPEGPLGVQPMRLSPRVEVLAGRRIGLLDNRKPNAGALLAHVGARLAQRTGATVSLAVQKSNAAFGKEKQRLLREHSNEALDDRATLASLGLDRDEFPTLKLELHSEPVAVPSVLQATIVSVMAPAVQAVKLVHKVVMTA